MNTRDYDINHGKQEGNQTNNGFIASSSRQWASILKNPRIVRVSRSFGGKDRHSKVCTIRGLRDRRIRLSVSTAIQLYDLQDRLGLGQPSKVIDWLLDVTKQDIDNLPHLQMPIRYFNQMDTTQACFTTFLDPNVKKKGININEEEGQPSVGKLKELEEQAFHEQEGNRSNSNDAKVLAQNYEFPFAGNTIFPLVNNSNISNMLPYNYYQLDPSNVSLPHFGTLGLPNSHVEHNPFLSLFPPMASPTFPMLNNSFELHSQVNEDFPPKP